MTGTRKHEDRRTRYTKQVIHDSFFELLRENGFEKMTVTDICRRAEINRGTFYLHYVDKFSLLEEVIDEALDADPPFDERNSTLCQRVPAHEDHLLLYQNRDTLPYVMSRIIEKASVSGISHVMETTGLDEATARLVFIFAASGNIAVNNEVGWKRSRRFSEIQTLIREVYEAGLEHISKR